VLYLRHAFLDSSIIVFVSVYRSLFSGYPFTVSFLPCRSGFHIRHSLSYFSTVPSYFCFIGPYCNHDCPAHCSAPWLRRPRLRSSHFRKREPCICSDTTPGSEHRTLGTNSIHQTEQHPPSRPRSTRRRCSQSPSRRRSQRPRWPSHSSFLLCHPQSSQRSMPLHRSTGGRLPPELNSCSTQGL